MLVFEERRKQEFTQRKTTQCKDENQQQTQPTHDAGNRVWATFLSLLGRECSHQCACPTECSHQAQSCLTASNRTKNTFFSLFTQWVFKYDLP